MADVKIHGLSIKCDLLSNNDNEDIKTFEIELTNTLKKIFGDNVYNIKADYGDIED